MAALPYPARSFDLVACRCVLMHQTDATVAAAEMHRVCEIGGFALAIEPDWGARALYPDAEALAELLELARRGRPYGFPDLLFGRKLFAVLRAVGFAPVSVRATAFVTTADDVAMSTHAAEGEGIVLMGPERLLEQGRRLLRTAGVASDAELDALIARLTAIPRSQDFCSAGLDIAAVGQKPAPGVLP